MFYSVCGSLEWRRKPAEQLLAQNPCYTLVALSTIFAKWHLMFELSQVLKQGTNALARNMRVPASQYAPYLDISYVYLNTSGELVLLAWHMYMYSPFPF